MKVKKEDILALLRNIYPGSTVHSLVLFKQYGKKLFFYGDKSDGLRKVFNNRIAIMALIGEGQKNDSGMYHFFFEFIESKCIGASVCSPRSSGFNSSKPIAEIFNQILESNHDV